MLISFWTTSLTDQVSGTSIVQHYLLDTVDRLHPGAPHSTGLHITVYWPLWD